MLKVPEGTVMSRLYRARKRLSRSVAGLTGAARARAARVRRRMNGAESLVGTAAAAGVEVCFANPGTTEMDLVRALDAVGGIRPVLGLFEGVCTAAADGYGRMAGRPALALLHLGPGLANGLANLHNARRARTPLVCLVGEHATWHRRRDAPLADGHRGPCAARVSAWVRTSSAAAEVAADTAAALAAAGSAPGVATLIVPADCAWSEPGRPGRGAAPAPRRRRSPTRWWRRRAACSPAPARSRCCSAAPRSASAGCARPGASPPPPAALLLAETFPARWERGGDLPAPRAAALLPRARDGGARRAASASCSPARGAPIAFFGYPGLPSELTPPGTPVATLAEPARGRRGGARTAGGRARRRGVRRPVRRAAAPRPPARRRRSRPAVAAARRSPPGSRRARSSSTRA